MGKFNPFRMNAHGKGKPISHFPAPNRKSAASVRRRGEPSGERPGGGAAVFVKVTAGEIDSLVFRPCRRLFRRNASRPSSSSPIRRPCRRHPLSRPRRSRHRILPLDSPPSLCPAAPAQDVGVQIQAQPQIIRSIPRPGWNAASFRLPIQSTRQLEAGCDASGVRACGRRPSLARWSTGHVNLESS